VINFVDEADKEIKWFVASQVNPAVTRKLLSYGCEVWGYHAAVNAGEGELIKQQAYAIISGGSATATRGIFLLAHMGFRKFKLYGYDLCFPDKPDMAAIDNFGQPKYLEFNVGIRNDYLNLKRIFFTEGQLIAQFEELNQMLQQGKFQIEAVGDGMIPFMVKILKVANLRHEELKCIMNGKLASYRDLWTNSQGSSALTVWRRIFLAIRRKPKVRKK
jgi:hypothetical protein